ncbi:predicted protein [Aspergillus terreus NIH2624]|uniref:Kelch-like protein terF n=1 Tax=Aspergillus terreus (strain NIH 2624 / FGSC A1156) TaxID=341663 RepID=TERF_ASPTN|nr:uncharacterized protein ATEG_00140 [Aspergillus terreus NIH2624]Q0D1P4.1 RecName: Full=Kelch-like protein terF; AltName: Full=Terrein biosynthesis cluster protein terF [Aspergillus terreus NIH2624]EAU38786.1 predicted protein [Aspergillus terreus NIH2624]
MPPTISDDTTVRSFTCAQPLGRAGYELIIRQMLHRFLSDLHTTKALLDRSLQATVNHAAGPVRSLLTIITVGFYTLLNWCSLGSYHTTKMISTVVTGLLLLASGCEALPTNQTPLPGKWSTLPNITLNGVEYPRQEHAAALVGDEIFVLGGILPWDGKEYATTNIVQKYNMITGTWTETAPMPAALNHANVAVVDGKIYYLGGLEAVDETYWNATGKSAVYDPATDEWTVLPSMPEGREIGSAATVVVDDTIYLPGGLAYTNITYDQEGTVSRFSSYNVRTQEWTTLPDLPAPRDHAGKGIYRDMLYILGGREFGNKNVVSTVFGFNLTSQQWATAFEPMPIARGGVASATIGSLIFTAGGEGDRRTPTAVFPEMQAYDAATNTWVDYADMPLPVHGSDAVVYKGEIVIPGGGIVTGATLTPVVQTFQPPLPDSGEKSMPLMVMVYRVVFDLPWMLFKR